jgi:hypothetical protein
MDMADIQAGFTAPVTTAAAASAGVWAFALAAKETFEKSPEPSRSGDFRFVD